MFGIRYALDGPGAFQYLHEQEAQRSNLRGHRGSLSAVGEPLRDLDRLAAGIGGVMPGLGTADLLARI
jgi:hypothetical protein